MKEVNKKVLKLDAISKQHDRELEGNRGAAPASLEERYLLDLKAPTGTEGGKKDRWPQRRPNSAIPAATRGKTAREPAFSAIEEVEEEFGDRPGARKKSALPQRDRRGQSYMYSSQSKIGVGPIRTGKEKHSMVATERNQFFEESKDGEGETSEGALPPGYMRQTLSNMFGRDHDRSFGGSDLSDDMLLLDENINIDEGIAVKDYKPSHLLEKKMKLIGQIKECRLKYLRERHTVHQYQHVLRRMELDRKHEMRVLHGLDPYFNFQDKIKTTLNDISTGKEQRQKIFEQKIRQIKYQLSEKQNIMQQDLRFKWRELEMLQRFNKKKGTQRTPRDRENLSDSHSVSGSTTYYAKSNVTRPRDASREEVKS